MTKPKSVTAAPRPVVATPTTRTLDPGRVHQPPIPKAPSSATAFGQVSEVLLDDHVTRAERERVDRLRGGSTDGAREFLQTVSGRLESAFVWDQLGADRQPRGFFKSLARAVLTGTTRVPIEAVELGKTVNGERSYLQKGEEFLGSTVHETFVRGWPEPAAEQPRIRATVDALVAAGAPLPEVLIAGAVLDRDGKAALLLRLASTLTDPTDLRLAASTVLWSIPEEGVRWQVASAFARNPNIEPDVAKSLNEGVADYEQRVAANNAWLNGAKSDAPYDALTPHDIRDLLEGDAAASNRALDAVVKALDAFEAYEPLKSKSTPAGRPNWLTSIVYDVVAGALLTSAAADIPPRAFLSAPGVRAGLTTRMRDLYSGRAEGEAYNLGFTDVELGWMRAAQEHALTMDAADPNAPTWLEPTQIWMQKTAPTAGETLLESHTMGPNALHASSYGAFRMPGDPSRLFMPSVLDSASKADPSTWPPEAWTPTPVPASLTDPAARGLFRAIDRAAQGLVRQVRTDDQGIVTARLDLLGGSTDPNVKRDLEAAAPDILKFFQQASLEAELTGTTLSISGGLPWGD